MYPAFIKYFWDNPSNDVGNSFNVFPKSLDTLNILQLRIKAKNVFPFIEIDYQEIMHMKVNSIKWN